MFGCGCQSVRGKCRRNLARHEVRAAWTCARTARQSRDCLRVRSLRHATLPAWRGRLSAPAFPAQHIRSALVLGLRRRGASPRGCLRTLRVRLRRICPQLRFGAFPRIRLVSRLRHASAYARPAARLRCLPSLPAAPLRRLSHPGGDALWPRCAALPRRSAPKSGGSTASQISRVPTVLAVLSVPDIPSGLSPEARHLICFFFIFIWAGRAGFCAKLIRAGRRPAKKGVRHEGRAPRKK